MLVTIFFGILGFGIMVFVHELGHFLAAKLAGIQVEIFSLGWGKRLIGFNRGGTSYQISWFPIGGFCKMKGDDLRKAGASQEEGSFYAAPAWKRILVAAAGPAANILFALLLLTLIWWTGFKIYSDENRIVLATDYTLDASVPSLPAAAAGLKTGDRVTAIGGRRVDKFQDILEKVSIAPNESLEFQVQREGKLLSLRVVPGLDRETGAGRIGVYAWREPLVDRVLKGGAADIAGLRTGDRITAVNGQQVRQTIDFHQAIKNAGDRVQLSLLRNDSPESRTMVIHYSEQGAVELGFSFYLPIFRSPSLSLGGALYQGWDETRKTLSITIKGIGLLFKGINLRNAIAGPLRITYYVGTAASSGFSLGFSEGIVSFFRFLCLLSVVLFLMNLLPIPAMDGGQILVFLAEMVVGKPINPKIIYRLQMASYSVLILLAVAITFSDILFFMGR